MSKIKTPNFHTHTNFCDGKNTPEETVVFAIYNGFKSIGFSGHGYTPFDTSYCMHDTEGYIAEIKRLKEKYKNQIEIYLGVEEDAFAPVQREKFDYVIGSCHYVFVNGEYYPVDSGVENFKKLLSVFKSDPVRLAESYYGAFTQYINSRKPDIIGHFDLITKYDEKMGERYFLGNTEYEKVAEKFLLKAVKSGCVFEVNTGAIARGLRSSVYPSEKLLTVLKKENARLILSADVHKAQGLDAYFEETKRYLKDIGFKNTFIFSKGEFCPIELD